MFMTLTSNAPRVGVGVLVADPTHGVLLTLRRHPPEAAHWSILGGRLELFETLQQCAVREAREEAGVDVVIERLLCVTDHILPYEESHWVSPAYLGRIISGEVVNAEPDKAFDVRWFWFDALPDNLTMTARRAIDAYLSTSGSTNALRPASPFAPPHPRRDQTWER